MSLLKEITVRDFLANIRNEPVKVFRVYNTNNQLITQYEAVTHAKDSDPCMKTQYDYDGTSARVIHLKESLDTWLIAYEMP